MLSQLLWLGQSQVSTVKDFLIKTHQVDDVLGRKDLVKTTITTTLAMG